MEKLKKLCYFLKERYPKNLNEIKSSLELLEEILQKTNNDIGNDISEITINGRYDAARMIIDQSEVINKYINNIEKLIEQLTISDTQDNSMPNYEDYYIDSKKEHYLNENFKHKRPYAFVLNGNGQKVSTWRQMLIETCQMLMDLDEHKFISLINDKSFKGRKRCYISYSKNGMHVPVRLKIENNIFVETNLSANATTKIIKKLLEKYAISLDNFIIYLRADYTALHEDKYL